MAIDTSSIKSVPHVRLPIKVVDTYSSNAATRWLAEDADGRAVTHGATAEEAQHKADWYARTGMFGFDALREASPRSSTLLF